MVMATTRGLNLALVVHPSIKSAADLKGKSVAITSFSGMPYTGLLLCLKELGLTREQVVPLNIGGKAARFEALVNDRVAARSPRPSICHHGGERRFQVDRRSDAPGCTVPAQYRRGL